MEVPLSLQTDLLHGIGLWNEAKVLEAEVEMPLLLQIP